MTRKRNGAAYSGKSGSSKAAKIDRTPRALAVNGLPIELISGTADDSPLELLHGNGSHVTIDSSAPVEGSATTDVFLDATSDQIQALVHSDFRLVQRCLEGDPSAWSDIYRSFHQPLLMSIKRYLNREGHDSNLVEEIAARVWYALVKNGFELLSRFDASRGCRLSTYLTVLARNETRVLFRTERRRRSREQLASRPDCCDNSVTESTQLISDHEFLVTLSDAERVYFLDVLVGSSADRPGESPAYSAENGWQLRHRVRKKVQQYVTDSDA